MKTNDRDDCVTSTVDVVLKLPANYVLPEVFRHASPHSLRTVFDCMTSVLVLIDTESAEGFASTLDRTREKMQECHENELLSLVSKFNKRLNDQKQQLLDERESAIDDRVSRMLRTVRAENDRLTRELEVLEKYKDDEVMKCRAKDDDQKMILQLYDTVIREKDVLMSDLTKKLDRLTSTIQNITSSSPAKGLFGERCMIAIVNGFFPSAEVRDVTHVPRSGDLVLRVDGLSIMIETKTKNSVSREDLVKFERDLCEHGSEYDAALFVTSSSGIPNRGEFDLTVNDNRPVMYVSRVFDDPRIVHLALRTLVCIVPLLRVTNGTDPPSQCPEEFSRLMESFSRTVKLAYEFIDLIKQNAKTLDTIARLALEQKNTNDKKLSRCIDEISRLTDEYKTKMAPQMQNYSRNCKATSSVVTRDLNDHDDLCRTVHEEWKRMVEEIGNDRFAYKKLAQRVIDSRKTSFTNVDRLVKSLPKNKFEEYRKRTSI